MIHGFHGALDWEREHGQNFLFDVELEVGEAGSSTSSRTPSITGTSQPASKRSRTRVPYHLLEALASAVADELVGALPGRARFRARAQAGRRCSTRRSRSQPCASRARDGRVRRPRRQPWRPRGDDPCRGRRASRWSIGVSTLRETDPVGVTDQPRFLNGVAALETDARAPGAARRPPRGRACGWGASARERWGPRTIDLDLLLYGDEVIDEDGLTVPHPRLHERRFVLEPLAELAPELVVPGLGGVEDLLAELD